jgi:hypothetical protein
MFPSVNELLVWNQILPLLGVPAEGSALPTTVPCPLCTTGRCCVYQDPVRSSQWYHCDDCGLAGDAVELLCQAWHLGVCAALRKANSLGIDFPPTALLEATAASYTTNRIEPRQRALAFWQRAQQHFSGGESSTIRGFQHQLGLRSTVTEHLLIGSASIQAVRSLLHPSAEGDKKRKTHYFKGKHWGDVLVFPFWDLPGRLCGFLFIGRSLTAPHDFIYRMAPEFSQMGRRPAPMEAGLAMLPAALLSSADFGHDTLFVMDDPLLALRLQFRWLRANLVPAPIVVIYADNQFQTMRVWDWCPRTEVLFWSPQLNGRLLAAARRANAQISTLHMSPQSLESNLHHWSAAGWLRAIRRARQPWHNVLQKVLRQLPDARAEELLLSMGLPDAEQHAFATTCDTDLRQRLERILVDRPQARQIVYGRHRVIERDNSWYLDNGRQICNFVVRIERILQTDAGRTYYRGVVCCEGKTAPFLERADFVDKRGLWSWCRGHIVRHGLGIPIFNIGWCRHALELALRFCPPQLVSGVDRIGWDEMRQQFSFPTFAITRTGTVVHDHPGLFSDPSVPGKLLKPPEALGTREVEALSARNDETRILFAATAAVAANIVAPAVNAKPMGTILDGVGAQGIGRMAAAYLGCPEIQQPTPDELGNVPYSWPRIVSLVDCTLQPFLPWLHAAPGQTILLLAPEAAKVLGIRRQWNTIRCDRRLGSMQLVNDAAIKILPAYLHDLCKRHLQLASPPDSVHSFLDDMADWLSREYGIDPWVVKAAGTVLESPKLTAATCVIELVHRLCQLGYLDTVRADHGGATPGCMVLQKAQEVVWIPQRHIVEQIELIAGIPPDVLLITKVLAEANALVKECIVAQQRGWLLKLPWFEDQIELLKTRIIE